MVCHVTSSRAALGSGTPTTRGAPGGLRERRKDAEETQTRRGLSPLARALMSLSFSDFDRLDPSNFAEFVFFSLALFFFGS